MTAKILNKDGVFLTDCKKARARQLLRLKQASIITKEPLIIQLNFQFNEKTRFLPLRTFVKVQKPSLISSWVFIPIVVLSIYVLIAALYLKYGPVTLQKTEILYLCAYVFFMSIITGVCVATIDIVLEIYPIKKMFRKLKWQLKRKI